MVRTSSCERSPTMRGKQVLLTYDQRLYIRVTRAACQALTAAEVGKKGGLGQ